MVQNLILISLYLLQNPRQNFHKAIDMFLLNNQRWRQSNNITSRANQQAFFIALNKTIKSPFAGFSSNRFQLNSGDKSQIANINYVPHSLPSMHPLSCVTSHLIG